MSRSTYTESEFRDAADGIRPGPDMEWFAVDCDGHVAGFTNAGFASIHSRVFDSFRQFNLTLDTIASLPCIGTGLGYETDDIWTDWAKRGLFAYDWNHNVGTLDVKLPYRQVRVPSAPITLTQLGDEVADYVGRIRFDTLCFQDAGQLLLNIE